MRGLEPRISCAGAGNCRVKSGNDVAVVYERCALSDQIAAMNSALA